MVDQSFDSTQAASEKMYMPNDSMNKSYQGKQNQYY